MYGDDEIMDTMDQEDGGAARMSESELLKGLIEAGTGKDSKDSYERIQIRRKGKLFFEFRIRPISEEESVECREKATKFAPRKRGQPKREIETNAAKFRSWLIYTATVDEDKKKTWDNKQLWRALEDHGKDILTYTDVIDVVLNPGEKAAIVDKIDLLSGFDGDFEEVSKN